LNLEAARERSCCAVIAASNAFMSISKPRSPPDVGREVDREAVGVVELEGGVAVEVFRVFGERRVEHGHAVLECLPEALLFLLEGRGHPGFVLPQLG
jgi:hypothetical protein